MLSEKIKRILSLALAFILTVSLMPVHALGAEADEEPTQETAATEPLGTTAPAAEAPSEPETTSAEEPEVAAESVDTAAVEALQARIDALLALYGITETMTDDEIAEAIFAADGDTIQKTMTERDAIDAYAMAMFAEKPSMLKLGLYERFWNIFDPIFNPVPAVAVTGVSGVEVTVDSNGSISESSGTVTVTVSGNFLSSKTTTITIKNTSGSSGTVSFKYELKNNANTPLSGSPYSQVLANGESFTFTLKSKSFTSNTTATMTLKEFSITPLSDRNVEVSFDSSKGTVKMDGTQISAGTHKVKDSTFVATPNANSVFLGWINPDTHEIITTEASYRCAPDADMKLQAVFAGNATSASNSPWFKVNGTHLYEGLAAATGMSGTKTVVLMNNATLPEGDYTIPSGVTLLIPYDAAGTLCTTEPSYHEDSYTPPSVFRTLTMANGANITVDGALSVSGSQSSQYGYNGMPSGPLGFIDMKSGSNITVSSGAKLYVWGYIKGSGNVEVQSGGFVYECFQIADYRGGDATSSMTSKADTYGVFPFNQYYIQNVEVPMKLHAGATVTGNSAVSVTLAGIQPFSLPFIGPSGSIFVIESGYIVKDYVEGTGRTKFEIYGDLSVTEVTIPLKVAVIGNINIVTSKYALPIPHHFTISLESGNVNINQSVAFLPGSELYIKAGTNCTLGSGKKIYIYDWDQWIYNNGANGYSGTSNLPYVKTKYVPGGDGTTGRTKDALVQIDGTVDASAGSVYVTAGGANICSTGTGVAKVASTTDATAYQVITNGSDISSWPEIAMQPAILQDKDGTDVATKEKAGTYTYYASTGKWCPPGHRYGEGVVTAPTCTEKGYTTHTCIACGDSYKDTEVAAKGHTEVIDAAVPAKFDTAGKTEGKHCSVCQVVLTEQTEINAAQVGDKTYTILSEAIKAADRKNNVTLLTNIDGDVPVSKPVTICKGDYSANITAGNGYKLSTNGSDVTVLIKIVAANISVGDGLDMYFYVLKDVMTETGYQAVITRSIQGTPQEPIRLNFDEAGSGWEEYEKDGIQYWRFPYRDIAAKEMTDELSVVVNYSDGTAATNTHTDSIRGYALRAFGQHGAELNTALMDMLNYGAGAQTHFGYNTGKLANAEDDTGIIKTYAGCATQEDVETASEHFKKGKNLKGVSFSAKNKLMMTFYFENITRDMTATISYTNHDGNSRTWEVPGSEFYQYNSALLGVDVKGLSVADGRCVVTCEVKDSTGDVIAYAADSVEGYVHRSGNEVMKLLMKFVDSAHAYFH